MPIFLRKSQSKHKNIKKEFNGKKYASIKEADYARTLFYKKLNKEIRFYLEQIPFRLPGNTRHYVDFMIVNNDDSIEFHEVKGRDLPMGKMKRQGVEEIYGIEIKVI